MLMHAMRDALRDYSGREMALKRAMGSDLNLLLIDDALHISGNSHNTTRPISGSFSPLNNSWSHVRHEQMPWHMGDIGDMLFKDRGVMLSGGKMGDDECVDCIYLLDLISDTNVWHESVMRGPL